MSDHDQVPATDTGHDRPALRRRRLRIGAWSAALAAIFLFGTFAIPGSAQAAISPPDTEITQVAVGRAPFGLAFNPTNGYEYVADSGNNAVSVIDGATRTPVGAPIPTGGSSPLAVAFNPTNGYLYVTNERSNTVTVIDGATNTVVGSPIPVGTFPGAVAVDTASGRVWVTNSRGDSISVISGTTNTVIGTIGVGARPLGIAYNPRNDSFYIANNSGASVSVVDASTGNVTGTVPDPGGPGTFAVAFNSLNGQMYITNQARSTVSVLDSATNTFEGSSIASGGAGASGIVFHPTSGYLYVVNQGSASVSLIDGATNALVGSPVAVGSVPIYPAYDANTELVYVANLGSNTVSVLGAAPVITSGPPSDGQVGDLYAFTITADAAPVPVTLAISVGRLPPGLTVDSSTGTISGTPSVSGTYTFTISATNGVCSGAEDTYTIDITGPSAVAPTITSGPPADTSAGSSYSHAVTASGTGPIAFAVSGGTLPPGLTLDTKTGLLAGVPSTAGTYTFSITATNVAGFDTAAYSVVVRSAPASPAALHPSSTADDSRPPTLARTGADPGSDGGVMAVSLLAAGSWILLSCHRSRARKPPTLNRPANRTNAI